MTKKAGEETRAADPIPADARLFAHGGTRTEDRTTPIGAEWDVAAPAESDGSSQHATYTETAADFFDLIFVTVALVTYTAQQIAAGAGPHTTAQRRTRPRDEFVLRESRAERDHRREASLSTIRFSRPTSITRADSDPAPLSSLTASTPDDRDDHDSRLTALDSHRPTGPPRLPFISVRGWTSRDA
jgi:hypothetical protein